jgi:predicted permease
VLLDELWRRALMFLHASRFRDDLEEEMQSHLAMKEDDLRRAGTRQDEARRAALVKFGNVSLLREKSFAAWGWTALEALLQDLRYTLRILGKSRVFTATAILTLALGIGGNTAIFSLIDAVMLRRMPVQDPDRLVQIAHFWGGQRTSLSFPLYELFRDQSQSFDGIFAQSWPAKQEINFGGEPDAVETQMVSGSYYAVLGVQPSIGRTFTSDWDRSPGASPFAVISYQYWKRRFGLDPSVIGKKFKLRKTVFTIVGVTPANFFGTMPGHAPDVTLPISMDAQVHGTRSWLADSKTVWLSVMARLKPTVALRQATAETQILFRNQISIDAGQEKDPRDKKAILSQELSLEPAGTGFDLLRIRFSEPLQLLMGIVGLVLLLACVNLSSLLLGRTSARLREISVRMALGAGRARLLRQFLAESFALTFVGGMAGIALAQLLCRVLVRTMSNGESLFLSVQPDLRILAFTSGVSLATGIAVGIVPALYAARQNISPGLRELRSGGGRTFGKMLIVTQIAISLVLLVGTSLFLRTLINLKTLDPGFRRGGVLTFEINADNAGYKDERLRNLETRILDHLDTLPGVSSASISQIRVLSGEGTGWKGTVEVEGYTNRPEENNWVYLNEIGPRYFRTLETPVMMGREFSEHDLPSSQKVAIVNQSFARYYFADKSPIGKHLSHDGSAEIVGVVKDVKYSDLREAIPRTVYFPSSQSESPRPDSTYLVRVASGDPLRIVSSASEVIQQIDPALRLTEPQTLAEIVDRSILTERFMAMLSIFFGLIALALASIGIFGVMAFYVARRTNEFGIRIALGAAQWNILWTVLSEVLAMLGAGTVIGLIAAASVTDLAKNLLFQLKPTDPASFVWAVMLLALTALAAGYIPARRATRVDPLEALRSE